MHALTADAPRHTRLLLILGALALLPAAAGCGEDAAGSASTTPDTEAPSVTILTPVDGAMVAGRIALTWDASDDVALKSIEVLVDGEAAVTLAPDADTWTWNSGGLEPGMYTLVVEATDGAGNTGNDTRTVELTTRCNEDGDCPPTGLTFVSHEDGAFVTGEVEVEVEVEDDEGVERVVFMHEGASVGESTGAPFKVTWSTDAAPEGPTTLTAVATDTVGQSVEATLEVTIDRTPPELTVTAPADGSFVGDILTLSAETSDNFEVASVKYGILGTTASLVVEVAPFGGEIDLSTFERGDYRLFTTAKDRAGLESAQDARAFILDRPPAVSFLEPDAATGVTGQVDVRVEASDDGSVERIELEVDGEPVGTFDADGHLSWQPEPGEYEATLEAIAIDDQGQEAVAVLVLQVAIDPCDLDGDGFESESAMCGGADCLDTDADSYPGAADTLGDDLDANCDGHDGVDADGDGHASVDSGGQDCDDTNPEISPCPGDLPDLCNDRQNDPRNCGACGVRCDVALSCVSAECTCTVGECEPGTPEDYDFGQPATFLSTISVIYDSNQGLDFDGDGQPDNAFGPLLQGLATFLNGDINNELATAISEGSLALGATWPDLPEDPVDAEGVDMDIFELADVDDNPFTRDMYYASANSFLPGYQTPRGNFRDGVIENRAFSAGPSPSFYLTVPLGGAPLNVIFYEAEIAGTVTRSAQGVRLSGGRLGGIVEVGQLIESVNDFLQSDLCACLDLDGPLVDLRNGIGSEACVGEYTSDACNTTPIEGVCAGIASYCSILMLVMSTSPDLDTDGDGANDAFSAYLRLEGSPTTILGPVP